jgi:hypothetical protein
MEKVEIPQPYLWGFQFPGSLENHSGGATSGQDGLDSHPNSSSVCKLCTFHPFTMTVLFDGNMRLSASA